MPFIDQGLPVFRSCGVVLAQALTWLLPRCCMPGTRLCNLPNAVRLGTMMWNGTLTESIFWLCFSVQSWNWSVKTMYGRVPSCSLITKFYSMYAISCRQVGGVTFASKQYGMWQDMKRHLNGSSQASDQRERMQMLTSSVSLVGEAAGESLMRPSSFFSVVWILFNLPAISVRCTRMRCWIIPVHQIAL